MGNTQTQLPIDTWISANWDEYTQLIESQADNQFKSYYYNGQLRIEPMSTGPDHSKDNAIIVLAVNLFGIIKSIPLNGLIGCSYRKIGVRECQPDVSYYIQESAQLVPQGSSVVDLDKYPPPELVIEISDTSLSDDVGNKRLLYEELPVREYWVVDVQKVQIRAFAVADGGSRRITESQVLPGLSISLLETTLQRSREMDQSQVGAWLLQQFQAM